MGTLWKIALRNTVRHRRRTIITAIVMTAGISVFIAFDSMLSGMDRMAVDNLAQYTVSSLKVRNPAYVEDIQASPLDKPLSDPEAALRAIRAEGLSATARIRFIAKLSNYTDEIPLLADAVDPRTDASVFALARSISAGSWLDGAASKSVVLGAALADELKIKVGDSVLVSAQTVNDTTNADEYSVVGLVDTPAPEVNRSGLFMPMAAARELLAAPETRGGFATEVDAALPREPTLNTTLAEGEKAAAALRAQLPGARVDPISFLARDYLSVRTAKAKYSFVLVFVVLIIAAVGIVNTILMSVYSRVREIGVLRAYGMTPKDIARLFTLEGLALGLVGSALGVGLGALLDWLLISQGINLDPYADAMGSLPLSGVLRGEWNLTTMAFGFVFGVVVSLVAARIPARRAAKLEPTDALRFV
ncbi:MAG TPA: FtsX-like permease family protein [Rectinemataceae bacterium]|nr:FtsX-like permease family protein [Rectinemataceae bacterium]